MCTASFKQHPTLVKPGERRSLGPPPTANRSGPALTLRLLRFLIQDVLCDAPIVSCPYDQVGTKRKFR